MKALLFVVGVLGLAAMFGLSEPAPASSQPVTLDDVQLVREHVDSQGSGQTRGKAIGRQRYGDRFRTARG